MTRYCRLMEAVSSVEVASSGVVVATKAGVEVKLMMRMAESKLFFEVP